MENIKNSISYLKGLMEGVELDCDKKETKVLYAIIDTLDLLTEEMEHLSQQNRYCEDMIDELLDDDFEDYELEYEFEEDGQPEFDFDDDFVEVECPHCHEIIEFDKDTYENSESLICPNCSNIVEG